MTSSIISLIRKIKCLFDYHCWEIKKYDEGLMTYTVPVCKYCKVIHVKNLK